LFCSIFFLFSCLWFSLTLFFFFPSFSLSFMFLFLCGFFLLSPSVLGFVELASMIVMILWFHVTTGLLTESQ
jgi:hypothetical protein